MHAALPLGFKGPLPITGGLACSNMKLKLQLQATNQLKFISACYLVSPAYQQPLFSFSSSQCQKHKFFFFHRIAEEGEIVFLPQPLFFCFSQTFFTLYFGLITLLVPEF